MKPTDWIRTIALIGATAATLVTPAPGSSLALPPPTPEPPPVAVVADFDGDGRTDVAVYGPRDATLLWQVKGLGTDVWGLATDRPVPGDYDGDGKSDLAVYRDGIWFIRESGGDHDRIDYWGMAQHIPVPGDYDDDRKTDLAVFERETAIWYIVKSKNGPVYVIFGLPGDRPVPADYDGDARNDVAVYRPSEGMWYVLRSGCEGQPDCPDPVLYRDWGLPTDIPVPANYVGDRRADWAIFRPETCDWWILENGPPDPEPIVVHLGEPGDLPAPGDYDGDGYAEPAVYHPESGAHRIQPLADPPGEVEVVLGGQSDRPVAGAYLFPADHPSPSTTKDAQ